MPVKGAAAFDGKRYWAASYEQIRPRLRANRVLIYDGGDDLAKRDRVNTPLVNLPH